VIGLGSGITAGAVARHPVQRIHIVEIEPAVIEAASFFRDEHDDVLADPRVRVTVADARSVLLTGSARYDVITSEPSNPWIGGLASLFSLEFFALARERLEPRGIMLQWIHSYNLLGEDLRTVVETFRTVFPATTVWQVSPGDFLLLGRTDAAPFDLVALKTRFQGNAAVRRDLERIGVRGWSGVLGYFALGEGDAARYARGARLNTDDHLILEFSAPQALHLDTHTDNARALRAFATTASLPALTAESAAALNDPEVRSGIAAVRASLGTSEPRR
jgi:spermidine synthase